MLVDSFNRPITYLRVSITDRCNLRCIYCMPPNGLKLRRHDEIMTYDEITQVVRVAVENGVKAVRITGGEPLVRKDVTKLISMLASIPGLDDLSMTTNAMLLEELAQPLADSGLKRVNISLDTLDPNKFNQITRGGKIERVWRGIYAAEKAGLLPIKINTVVMGGVNDDEIGEIAKLSLIHPWYIRFIEWMPVKNLHDLSLEFIDPEKFYVPVSDIYSRLQNLELEPTTNGTGSGPARMFKPKNGPGKIGIISAIGEHFCAQCNRLRLTADGRLRSCLFSNSEVSLLSALRNGEDIFPYFLEVAKTKQSAHSEALDKFASNRGMSQIGG